MKHSLQILLIINIFLVTACSGNPANEILQNQSGMQNTLITDPMMAQYNKAPRVEESLKKISERIIDEPVFRGCMEQAINQCGNEFIHMTAKNLRSAEICNDFQIPSLRESCKQVVVTSKALKTNDSKICDDLGNTKQSCVQQVTVAQAVSARDLRQCERLRINKNSSGQIVSMSDGADHCILQVIGSTSASEGLKKSCHLIQDTSTKTNCIEMTASRIKMEASMRTTLSGGKVY